MAVSLEKTKKINLRKQQVEEITVKLNLHQLISRVSMAVDFSGSMEHLYRSDVVQTLIERILPIAMKFDDNAELEFWLFHHHFYRLENITLSNFDNYINNVINRYSMGGTNYAPVLENIYEHYVEEEPSNVPSYVLFITDGDNADKEDTQRILTKLHSTNVYVQMIGLGNCDYPFLKQCASTYNNVDFINIIDLQTIDDEELYNRLLIKYAKWINGDVAHINEGYNKPKKVSVIQKVWNKITSIFGR